MNKRAKGNKKPPQHETTSLPPIEKHNGVSPHHSPTASKKMSVHERLYDPDYRKNRSIPTEPEPIYVREFKSRPPKNLEHVKSKHMDPSYFEPRGEYVIETDEEPASPQFKAKPPRGMEHIESRHMNPEYQKKRSSDEASGDEQFNQHFHARLPKGMEHVQSKILNPKYYQEKQQPEDNEYYDTEFRARPPKKLENVQSRIMDPKYFQEKQAPEEERYDTEFRARLPKKLEHVQSRLLDPPRKPKQSYEELDSISLPSFRAKPPRHLEQVSSRILDPQYYEPKPEYSYENEEKYDHNFKARIPKRMQHVESRVLDSKYFKKKIPPIPTEEREAQNLNHDFKARIPKNLAHVQSRFFDPAYNKQLSPRSASPVVELKQRGQVVVINVKKNPERRSKSQGHKDKVFTPRGQYHSHGRQDGIKTGLGLTAPEEELKPVEKKPKKPWRPPRGPKPEIIDREFFDSWTMSPTHLHRENNDLFYKNRKNVSEMWTSLARTIKKSVIENGERIRPIERTYY